MRPKKAKKTRKKTYRPRDSFASPIVLGYIHEDSPTLHLDLDLAGLTQLRAIETGPFSHANIDAVTLAMKEGSILSQAFEESARHQMLFVLARVALGECRKMIPPPTPEVPMPACEEGAPPHLTEAAHAALNVLSDMERAVSETELSRATQVTIKNQRKLLPYHPDAVRIVDPSRPETWRDIVNRPMECRGGAFVNGRVRTGYLSHRDEHLRFEMPIEEMNAKIEKPLLFLMAEPKKMKPCPTQTKE